MFKAFEHKAPPPARMGGKAEQLRTEVSNVVAFCVLCLLLAGIAVTIAFQLATKNHDITELKNRILRLEHENKELAKSISDRKVVLEQLKDGSRILRQAKMLGLRLPSTGQNVRCLQVVINGDESSTILPEETAQSGMRDWRLASR